MMSFIFLHSGPPEQSSQIHIFEILKEQRIPVVLERFSNVENKCHYKITGLANLLQTKGGNLT